MLHSLSVVQALLTPSLLQGSYQVKFLVDSEWRLAPEWPTTTTADGSTNNLLVVE